MTVAVRALIPETLVDETNGVRNGWGWVLALGIGQILVGALAVSFVFGATILSVVTLGMMLLIAAAAQTVAGILARDWGGFWMFLLLGTFYAVAGILTIQHPILAAEGLTLMLAAVFLIGGAFRIISACVERFPWRGWVFFSGVVSVLLGVLIWRQWPVSGLWVLGLFIGIDLIVNGVTCSMLAIFVRKKSTQLSTGRA